MREPPVITPEISERAKALVIGAIPSLSPVLFMPALQGRGGTLIDRSGKGNNGAIVGAAWKRFPRGLPALSFNGNDYVSLGSLTSFPAGSSARTVLFWAKTTESPATDWRIVSGYGNDALRQAFNVGQQKTSDKLYVALYGEDIASDYTWVINTLTHIAVTLSGTTVQFYVNGVLNSTGTASGTVNTVLTAGTIGKWSGPAANYFWKGLIGWVILAPSVLSAPVIASIYNRQRTLIGA